MLAVGTSVVFADRSASGGVDAWFAAVLTWAVVAETRQPRQGRRVLVLLGIAGLLRPDTWVFAALYALYLFPTLSTRRRAETVALVVAPPALWLGFDAAITGDPLYSLTHTQSGADALDRPTGVTHVPRAFADSIREMLRLPIAAGGLLGIGLALALRKPSIEPMLAVIVLGSAIFVALGVVGLPLNDRYLFDVAALVAIFAGYLALGWIGAAPGRLRMAWAAAGLLLLLAVAAKAPGRVDGMRLERAALAARARVANDLRAVVRTPQAVAAIRRCSAVQVFDVRAVPYARLPARPPRPSAVVLPPFRCPAPGAAACSGALRD